MDSPPPPDLPEPASPNPAARPPTKIRSLPTRAARLPGTYAAHFDGDDMNWRRGLTILWVLVGTTAGVEIVRSVLALLAGLGGPTLIGVFRVGGSTALFLALWPGHGFVRWGLVAFDFCAGLYLALWGVIANPVMGSGFPAGSTAAEAAPLLAEMPGIVLGLLYLGTAAYVAMSADVVDFLRHRREAGRGWVLAPLAVLGLGYLGVFGVLEVPYRFWLGSPYAQARDFGDETTQRMAAHWDPQSIAGLGNARFNQGWTEDYQRQVFASLAPLGPNEHLGVWRMQRQPPLFIPAEGGVIRQYAYSLTQARFAHGSADLDLVVSKPLFRPWQIDDLQVNDVRYDPKPTPAPPPEPARTTETVPTGG